MPTRRPRFRPPGVKPWSRIGPLGPFRGRLGLGWVIAPLVLGAVLALFAWLLLFRSSGPGGSFRNVGPLASFSEGSIRPTDTPGVFVARTGGRLVAVRASGGCSLSVCGDRYVDCRGSEYGPDGSSASGPGSLQLIPVVVSGGSVYVDPAHPSPATPGEPQPTPTACPSPTAAGPA
jgi:hypothetical protein